MTFSNDFKYCTLYFHSIKYLNIVFKYYILNFIFSPFIQRGMIAYTVHCYIVFIKHAEFIIQPNTISYFSVTILRREICLINHVYYSEYLAYFCILFAPSTMRKSPLGAVIIVSANERAYIRGSSVTRSRIPEIYFYFHALLRLVVTQPTVVPRSF